jgi:hypothetical protein
MMTKAAPVDVTQKLVGNWTTHLWRRLKAQVCQEFEIQKFPHFSRYLRTLVAQI